MLPVKDHQNGKDKMMFKEQKLHFCLMVNIAQIHAWKIEEDGQQKWLKMTPTQQPLPLIVNYKVDGRARLVLRSNPK